MAKLEPKDVVEGPEKWRNSVIGIVPGAAPPFNLMKRYVEAIWGKYGKGECVRMKS